MRQVDNGLTQVRREPRRQMPRYDRPELNEMPPEGYCRLTSKTRGS